MAKVTLTINGKSVTVPEGTSILNAAKTLGIKIPTLCYTPDLPAWASCGMCVIKNVDPRTGRARMARACCTAVTPGMNIVTQDAELMKARRTVLELILSNHPNDCLKCSRSGQCELQTLAQEFGLRSVRFQEILKNQEPDASYPEVVLYRNKCINCGRCVEACQQMQNVWALEYNGRGDKTIIGPVGGVDLAHSPCVHCGQCAVHCPTGAIMSLNPINTVFDKLADPTLTSVVAIAPSVRAAIGEEFGFKPGTLTTGKIYAALRALGFKYVFDTNFAADLTIMEEGSELVERIVNGGKEEPLPMFTSCCPGWVDYAEKHYKDLLPNLSTAKSPQAMQGAMTKTYFADKIGKKAKEIYNVSVMPCAAKLYESQRDKSMKSSGVDDYDMVLTTRELAQLIKEAGIDFANLPEDKADSPIGAYTGAGTIFGATGGVMEAAVRTAYYLVNKKELGPIDFKDVRGLDGVKEADVTVKKGLVLKLCVIHQLGNVDEIMQKIRDAYKNKTEQPYTFVEVMACRGGCVGGGGQPYGVTDELRKQRAAALYKDDKDCKIRQSHNNPEIKQIYKEFLDKPLSEKAHKYLHTSYKALDQYRY
jgi:NADH-quinone oxidoreductase subunit G